MISKLIKYLKGFRIEFKKSPQYYMTDSWNRTGSSVWKSRRFWIRYGAPFTVLTVLIVVGLYTYFTVRKKEKITLPEVRVVKVIRRDLTKKITLPGSVTFKEKASITPKYGGKIAKINVDVGDMVKTGQVLGELEKRDLSLQLRKASANVRSSEVNLDMANTREREDKKEVEKNLESLARDRSDVITARTTLYAARRDLMNKLDLYKIGGLSFVELQNTYAGYLGALSDYYKMEKNLSINEIGFRAQDLKAAGLDVPSNGEELRTSLIQLNTELSRKSVQISKTQYDSAKIERDTVRNMLNEADLKSPINGVVAERAFDIGEMVTAEQPVFIVVYTDKLYVEVGIPESHIFEVSLGDSVEASFANFDKKYEVPVHIISPIIEPTSRTFKVKLLLENQDGIIKPGMYVKCTFTLDKAEDAISVPAQSVLFDNETEQPHVFTVKENSVFKTNLELIGKYGDYYAVKSGLKEGDLVVESEGELLQDGMKIEPELVE